MIEIERQIKIAQSLFRDKLLALDSSGGLTKERYIRFLSVQYHLNKGVQKTFFSIAANGIMSRKRDLRKWLIQFGQEEEPHFELAKADLKELESDPLPCPFDVKAWWLHFDSVIQERPFVRLGGTCILENIGSGSADILDKMIKSSVFLTPKNLRYLIIHQHGPNLDHGNQVLEALEKGDLSEEQLADVLEGAKTATTLYLRIAHWMFTGEELK